MHTATATVPVTDTAINACNRRNAQHSTGPRTALGKGASSQNARKHGLTATTHHILAKEDPADYAALEAEIVAIYDPKSPRERLAATEIAKCRWALQRFDEAEMLLLNAHLSSASLSGQEPTPGEAIAACCATGPGLTYSPIPISMDLLMRYRRPWDRRHQNALYEFNQARLDRHREDRLSLAKERQAHQQHRQQQADTLKELKATQKLREMQHIERRLGFHNPDASPTASGFVSSPAKMASRTEQSSAAA